MRPWIPRALARRIDRLARRAHGFHRFAHHPLCDQYAGELVQLGRTRICRGCALFAAGGMVGFAAGLILHPAPLIALGAMAVGVVLAAGSLRWRGSKVITRLVPAAGLGFAISGGLIAAGVAVASFGLLAIAYRRRGPHRSPCATCPERSLAPCRGMAEIVRAERAFQRLSGRWLSGSSLSNVMIK